MFVTWNCFVFPATSTIELRLSLSYFGPQIEIKLNKKNKKNANLSLHVRLSASKWQ